MFELTTMRIWIVVSLVWPLFWVLVFDRWFFFSPIGVLIAIGPPLAGWLFWWNFYRGEEEKMVSDGRLVLDKSVETLQRLKRQHSNRQQSKPGKS